MIRVTTDTNIIVSGLNFPGNARQLLASAEAGTIRLCVSPAILDEVGCDARQCSTGLLRSWIVLSALWVVVICMVSFGEVRDEFKNASNQAKIDAGWQPSLPVDCHSARGRAVSARLEEILARHYHRYKEVGRESHKSPSEPRRCYADDRKRTLIEPHCTAQDGMIVVKMSVPICIAKHQRRDATRPMFIGTTMEEKAKVRLNA